MSVRYCEYNTGYCCSHWKKLKGVCPSFSPGENTRIYMEQISQKRFLVMAEVYDKMVQGM